MLAQRLISLHCPLTHETSRMFTAPELAAMNDSVFLINTCRGESSNEGDLIAALASGRWRARDERGRENEPIGAVHVLLSTPDVIVTPHLGGYSVVSLRGMGRKP
ncbi:MAG: hypothetical protein IPQ15_05520 [Betaproteobacteria bacterium]|nr:hypothetical protein [Betaproteobacteria bacterium]